MAAAKAIVRVMRMLLLPVLIYLAACAYLYFAQSRLLYFPTQQSPAGGAATLWLQSANTRIQVTQIRPQQARAVVYFGGNAEAVDAMGELLSRWFPEHSIYLMHYRGFDASEGQPDEAGLFADAQVLFDRLSSLHRDISVIGRSLGSGVAMHLASQRPVSKLALITPYDSIEALAEARYPWVPVRWLLRDKYRSIDRTPEVDQPVLVLMAEHDSVVPRAHSQRLIAAFPRAQVEALTIADSNHSSIVAGEGFERALRQFLAAPAASVP